MKIKHKYVSSYFIVNHKSGITSLTFNTHEKWIPFHMYNYDLYKFGEDTDEESEQDHADRCLSVEIELKQVLPTVLQEKDQITFYFIPISMLD